MCYIFGDPHFLSFDGAQPYFIKMNSVDSWGRTLPDNINNFYAVKTQNLEIQGYAEGDPSWMQGVIVTGELIGGHELAAKRTFGRIEVTWDGKKILTNPGDQLVSGGFAFHRASRLKYLPPEEELRKLWGTVEAQWYDLKRSLGSWKSGQDVFTFKFPGNIEIHMTETKLPTGQTCWDPIRGGMDCFGTAMEVVIMMPPTPGQGGWCGNFNGDPKDDKFSTYLKAVGDMGQDRPASNRPPWCTAWDFTPECMQLRQKRMQLRRSSTNKTSDEIQNSDQRKSITTIADCDETVLQVARAACDHIVDKGLRDACIMDSCTTAEPILAMEAADDTLVMKSVNGAKRKKCQLLEPR